MEPESAMEWIGGQEKITAVGLIEHVHGDGYTEDHVVKAAKFLKSLEAMGWVEDIGHHFQQGTIYRPKPAADRRQAYIDTQIEAARYVRGGE